MRLEIEPTTSPMAFSEDAVSDAAVAENDATAAREALHDGIKAAQAGKRAQARASLLRAAELDPKSENAWLWLASISEYPEELLVFLNNVLEINPRNDRALEWTAATRSLLAKTFVQRGIDAAQDNQSDFAVECFNKALEYDQQNSMAWLWMASLSDSNEGKITYLERVLSIEPDNNEARLGIERAKAEINDKLLAEARSAAVAGRVSEAIELVEAIAEITPDCVDAWILKAHLVDGFAEKIKCFERALEIRPDHTAARAGRDSLAAIVGTVFEAEGRQQAAEAAETDAEEVVTEDAAPETEAVEELSLTQDLQWPDVLREELVEPAVEEAATETYEYEEIESVEFTPEPDTLSTQEAEELVEETVTEVVEVAEGSFEVYAAEPEASVEPAEEVEYTNGSAEAVPASFEPAEPEQFNGNGSSEPEHSLPESVSVWEPKVHFPEQPSFVNLSEPELASGIPMPQADLPVSHPAPTGFETRLEVVPAPVVNAISVSKPEACPFCFTEKEVQTIVCQTCMAVLTLSDLEMLLGNQHADRSIVRQAVESMERERGYREISEGELTTLGIGHLNLRNLQSGHAALLEASNRNPNNVVLSRQVNALHIRLEEIRAQDEAHEKMTKGKTILVVDDSPTVRKLIAGKLEKCGHAVFCSNDGVEAIEHMAEILPDLVLLDITMPRMDGYQVCKAIRSNPATKDIPVVMISGKDGFFDKVRGKMAGTTGYITKPFGPETLMKAVETYLQGEVPEAGI